MTSVFAVLALLSTVPSAPGAAAVSAEATATPAAVVESAKGEEQELFDQAIAQYKAGDCDAAMPSLKTLVAMNVRQMESSLALRDCYQVKFKTPEAAVAALEAEVKANPNDEVAHSNLGCFYMLEQKRDEAKTELIRALQLNPNDLDARANLAFWYAAVGQSHTAIKEYENILKSDTDNKRSLTELCNLIAEQENDAKRAQPYCERAIAGQEDNEILGVTLGAVMMRQGNYDGAEKTLSKVLEKHADATSARTFLGVSRLQRGDYEGAQAAFEKVLESKPADTDAHVFLARTLQAKKEFGAAAAQYRLAYQQSRNGMLLGALVKVYIQQYFFAIIVVLLVAMAGLLWRYLNVKTPEAPAPPRPASA